MDILGLIGQQYMFILLVIMFIGFGLGTWAVIKPIFSKEEGKKGTAKASTNANSNVSKQVINNTKINKILGGIKMNNGWLKLGVFSLIGLVISVAILGFVNSNSTMTMQNGMNMNNMSNMNMNNMSNMSNMSNMNNMNNMSNMSNMSNMNMNNMNNMSNMSNMGNTNIQNQLNQMQMQLNQMQTQMQQNNSNMNNMNNSNSNSNSNSSGSGSMSSMPMM